MDAASVGKLAGRRNAGAGQVGRDICGLERNSPERFASPHGLRTGHSFHAYIIHLSLFTCRVRLEVKFLKLNHFSQSEAVRMVSVVLHAEVGAGSALEERAVYCLAG